ncbi:hypothetical protein J2128_002049 [Methanomicrobium sp. W14]|nr:hypothetical protein [Methanomicrobium sp. W14]MBP2134083.1 hypothetical protein [Methanomicrobium sp. W14]
MKIFNEKPSVRDEAFSYLSHDPAEQTNERRIYQKKLLSFLKNSALTG